MITSRNLWPWGIMATFVVFISCTIGLIVMACMHREELVATDYYEQEIRYQSQLERENRTQPIAFQALVSYDGARQCIEVVLPTTPGQPSLQGHIQLYRPSAAGLDRQVELALNTAGRQTIDASHLRPGLWKVRVCWTMGHQEYYIDQKVIVQTKPS